MEQITEFYAKLNIFNELKDTLTPDLKKIVQDKSLPLDDRWKLFIESDLGDHDTNYHEPDGIDWNKHSLYDDFYCDRYATLDADSMLRIAQENNLFETPENEIEFKEYFLTAFIKSFENDW